MRVVFKDIKLISFKGVTEGEEKKKERGRESVGVKRKREKR